MIDAEVVKTTTPEVTAGKPQGQGANINKAAKGKGKPQGKKYIPILQGPQALSANTNIAKTRDDPIYKEAIFAPSIAVEEVNPTVRFNNCYASLLRLTPELMMIYQSQNSKLGYSLTQEMLNYYVTGLLWVRLIDVRRLGHRVLTQNEVRVLRLVEDVPYEIPEPVYVYHKAIGQIVTMPGQHLYTDSPPLPDGVVNGVGGLFGPIALDNADNVIDYCEYPTLGLTSEALQQTLVDNVNPMYVSVVSLPQHRANLNALGVSVVVRPQREINRILAGINITGDQFSEDVANTRFNFRLMNLISDTLRGLKGYKTYMIQMPKLETTGSLAQVVKCTPTPSADPTIPILTSLPILTTSVSSDSKVCFGVAAAFEFQIMREAVGTDPAPPADEPPAPVDPAELARLQAEEQLRIAVLAQARDLFIAQGLEPPGELGHEAPPAVADAPHLAHKNWLPLTFDNATPAPAPWVAVRNIYRNLPPRYYDEVFTGKQSLPNVTRR